MILSVFKVLINIIINYKENLTILILNDEELEKLNLSDLENGKEKKIEDKIHFPIYMGNEKIN